ncbi:MAG: very short patch repair endonuclease [Verrucomicrobiia bacterium]
MPDVFTKAKRSEVMSRIRGRGNKDTELALARSLRQHGIKGWRRHFVLKFKVRGSKFPPSHGFGAASKVRGSLRPARREPRPTGRVTPDFVFRQVRLAIFVDGCFWHGCPKHATKPANNRAFWKKKLAGNKTRDRVVNQTLRRAGWRVLRIWECDLAKHPETCVHRIQRAMR